MTTKQGDICRNFRVDKLYNVISRPPVSREGHVKASKSTQLSCTTQSRQCFRAAIRHDRTIPVTWTATAPTSCVHTLHT